MSSLPLDQILSVRPDPLDVLKTTARVVSRAHSVRIEPAAVGRAADALVVQQATPPLWNYDYHFYDGTPRSVNYIFLLDALNFSFWGQPRWKINFRQQVLDGYWALAAALKRAADEEPAMLEGNFMASVTPEHLSKILRGNGQIPLFIQRWRNMRELGAVLVSLWEGQAARLVECAQRDAVRLVQMVVENLSSFNDISVYDGQEVRFFKRAQIVVTDLWGEFQRKDWGEFENIDALTAFSDYKLPQILRAWGILRYAPALARKVDRRIQLAADSPEEIEIRAATLWSVELLRHALELRGRSLWSVQIDWILWQASQEKRRGMKPYHRVRTIYY